jgi:hypothetical protein
MNHHRYLIFGLLALALLAGSALLCAQPAASNPAPATSQNVAVDSASNLWLHVDVETNYGWFWQKSTGRAYVTEGKDGKKRHAVGKLCLQLVAHDSTVQCLSGADSILVTEKKKGLGIHKRTAYVTAWTENPALDTTRVQITP